MLEQQKPLEINKLSKEEVQNLSDSLGIKVRGMVDEAADKINALLKIYSMNAKLQVVIEQLDAPKPKRRGRPRKQS